MAAVHVVAQADDDEVFALGLPLPEITHLQYQLQGVVVGMEIADDEVAGRLEAAHAQGAGAVR